MNLFIELHQQLIRRLLENKVDFIIIGGYSVIFYGYQRTGRLKDQADVEKLQQTLNARAGR